MIIFIIQWVGDSKTKKFTHKSKAQANHHLIIRSYQYLIIFHYHYHYLIILSDISILSPYHKSNPQTKCQWSSFWILGKFLIRSIMIYPYETITLHKKYLTTKSYCIEYVPSPLKQLFGTEDSTFTHLYDIFNWKLYMRYSIEYLTSSLRLAQSRTAAQWSMRPKGKLFEIFIKLLL